MKKPGIFRAPYTKLTNKIFIKPKFYEEPVYQAS